MDQQKFSIENILRVAKIIPSVELLDEFDAIPLMDALINGGVRVVEIALRTQASYDSLEIIKKRIPDLIIGAGSVKTPDMLQKAYDAGADYATSPGNTDKLLDAVSKISLPFLPGVSNGSDIMRALEYGHTSQKFCPATALGGVKTLKYLHGSFSEVTFCPAGGLNDDNMGDFLALSNVACVTGSWIVRSHDTYEKKWNKVIERTKFSLENAQRYN
ncbi:MAG: bifunctional 4-hydroxy-2-oxoglutarate aldolase/2-dehydro-3-deoxy-phosphogluconate aldolase [Pseudomonadota bacterium]